MAAAGVVKSGIVGGVLVLLGACATVPAPTLNEPDSQAWLAKQQNRHGVGHLKTAPALMAVGKAQLHQNRPVEAARHIQKALEIYQRDAPSHKLPIAHALQALSSAQLALKSFGPALDSLTQATQLYTDLRALTPAHQAELAQQRAHIYLALGIFKSALTQTDIAYGLLQDSDKPHLALKAEIFSTQGHTLFQLKHYSKAFEAYSNALIHWRTLRNIPREIATLKQLGKTQARQSQYAKAFAYLQEAFALLNQTQPNNHAERFDSLITMGDYQQVMSNFEVAATYYQRALDFPNTNASQTIIGLEKLAQTAIGQANYPQALKHLNEALALSSEQWGEQHQSAAPVLNTLGVVHSRLSQIPKAIKYYQRALDIYQHSAGPDIAEQAEAYNNLGNAYYDQRNHQKSLSLFQQALTLMKQQYGPRHVKMAKPLNNIGNAHLRLGNNARALTYYQQALGILEKNHGSTHSDVAATVNNLGIIYDELSQTSKAIQHYERAIEIRQQLHGADHLSSVSPLYNLSKLWQSKDRRKEAILYAKRVVNILQKKRADLSGLDPEAQKAFGKKRGVQLPYKHLAKLLRADGQKALSQKVMKMLKANTVSREPELLSL